ncbi:MAG: pyridoxamine 5'-phosphate oxidase [Gemmatimonadales bacterium]
MSLADRRIDYQRGVLDEGHLAPDPITQFTQWFAEAESAEVPEPNAMTLATVGPDGTPAGRIVLLKGVDHGGFVFFTDYRSQKGRELEQSGRAALVFFWQPLERQVRITGTVARIAPGESDQYFDSRPRGSQAGAWASRQSQVVVGRSAIDEAVAEAERRFGNGPIPRPEHWGGYRVMPDQIEFWQGRASRLHDRLRYRRDAGAWLIERLAP